ncbi:MAG: hypothetical protein MRJ52_03185 [Nitrosomonas sp.]|nr:hypothetical protein [Nitrosomonas sp.]
MIEANFLRHADLNKAVQPLGIAVDNIVRTAADLRATPSAAIEMAYCFLSCYQVMPASVRTEPMPYL